MVSLLALVCALLPVPARADDHGGGPPDRFYVGVEGGLGVINGFSTGVPFAGDTGFRVGAAALVRGGVQWRDHVRIGGQVGWQGADVDGLGSRLDLAYSTANVHYDFGERDARVRPYLGVGLGVAGGWLRSRSPFAAGALARQQGVGFAYVIHGGGRFRIGDDLWLAAAWQFLGTAALIDRALGGSIDPTMHAFMVGLHRSF